MNIKNIADKYKVNQEELVKALDKVNKKEVIVYAMSGKMGAGKDTVGDLIKDRLIAYGYDVVGFSYSSPMRKEMQEIVDLNLQGLTNEEIAIKMDTIVDDIKNFLEILDNNPIYERTDASRRAIQFWGTGVRRKQDKDYWINKLVELSIDSINQNKSVYISDVRYDNEVDSIVNLNGKVIRLEVTEEVQIQRITTRDNLIPSKEHLSHLSEIALDNYKFETAFNSDDTLDNLLTSSLKYLGVIPKGVFITLEGPDGSGKSTVANMVVGYLEKLGVKCILTREPGGTDIGEGIRQMLLDNNNAKMTARTEALLYAASRAQHVEEKIKPLLDEGFVVISDRFVLSSLAYQGFARGLGLEEVKKINDFAIAPLKEYENNIIFLDIDPEIALKRIFSKREGDRLENEGVKFHNKVHQGYKEILKTLDYQVSVINADGTVKQSAEQAKKIIDDILYRQIGIL